MSANDIFRALQFAKGMKNTKVGVVEIDSSKSFLQGKIICDISQFHSVEFLDDGMRFWRYFDVGEGVFHPYTNVLFKSAVEISIPYVWCSKDGSVVPERPLSTKRRVNRSLRSILFCSEPLCSDTFDTTEQLENHMLENNHSFSKTNTAMDNVKSTFITKMKSSAVNNLPMSSTCRISSMQSNCPLFDIFNREGWALHTRSNFLFNDKQKALLWNYFINGEKTGKKETPEEVHMVLRKVLQPHDYVTPQQIKSLFSRWTREKASSPPKPTNVSDNDTSEDVIEGMEIILSLLMKTF